MCRIIGFVSVDNFYEKSKLILELSKCLSDSGKRVCLLDSFFGMNKLSLMIDENKGVDLKEYLIGRLGTLSVLNKVNSNLYYLKTNSISFDYDSHINLIQFYISEISEKFDYILIDINNVDYKKSNSILNSINEVIVLSSDEEIVIRNTSKLLLALKQYSNIYDFKLILINIRIFMGYKNKCLTYKEIEHVLKTEVISIIPKFYNLKKLKSKRNNCIKVIAESLMKNTNHLAWFYKYNLNPINKLRYSKYE